MFCLDNFNHPMLGRLSLICPSFIGGAKKIYFPSLQLRSAKTITFKSALIGIIKITRIFPCQMAKEVFDASKNVEDKA